MIENMSAAVLRVLTNQIKKQTKTRERFEEIIVLYHTNGLLSDEEMLKAMKVLNEYYPTVEE